VSQSAALWVSTVAPNQCAKGMLGFPFQVDHPKTPLQIKESQFLLIQNEVTTYPPISRFY